MENKQIIKALEVLLKVLVETAPDGPFTSCMDDTGLFGVEAGAGGLVYESDMTEFQAKLVAWLLNQDETLEWDDIAPLVMLFDV